MYKHGGYIYNYDGTDIVEDPDCYEDPDMECDWDQPDWDDEDSDDDLPALDKDDVVDEVYDA